MLKIIEFGKEYITPVVLCLGHYESLHKGHREIIEGAKKLAKDMGAEVMLMTVNEGDNARFGRVILDFNERTSLLFGMGVGSVLSVDFSDDFKNLSAEEFLNKLFSTLNVKAFACGFDFRFGKNRMGDTAYLTERAQRKNLPVYISEKVEYNGEKISTSTIKQLLFSGDVLQANEQLGYNFFIKGVVQEGRKQGREMGFPTANLIVENHRFCVKNGVYVVQTAVDGNIYKGIANVGSAPTFDFYQNVVEVHLKHFNGNLYGKELKIEFLDYIRETVKFSCIEELKAQLQKDLDGIKG